MLALNKQLKIAVCEQNNPAKVKSILNCGADANLRVNKDAGNLLHHTRNPEIATLLLDKGANVEARNRYRSTPLLIAVKQNDVELAKVFLRYNASTSCRTMNNRLSPLHIAVLNNNPDMVTLLLDYGSDVNDCGSNSLDTPLHLVLQKKYIYMKLINLLLKRGANTNVVNKDKESPLHIALQNSFCPSSVVEVLITYKADIQCIDSESNTPIHHAVYKSDIEKIKILLKHGANIFSYNCYGSNALHSAVNSNGVVEVIKLLLEHSYNIDLCSESNSASNVTTSRKYVNALNIHKLTPLQLVIYYHLSWIGKDVIEELLRHGASISTEDYKILYSLLMKHSTPETNILNLNQHNFDESVHERNKHSNERDFIEKVVKLLVKFDVLNSSVNISVLKSDEKFSFLIDFIKTCENERFLIENELTISSLYELVVYQGTRCSLPVDLVGKILKVYINGTYPLYRDLLIMSLQRSDLLNLLFEEKFSVKNERKIFLDWASIKNLIKYLSDSDLFNLTVACSKYPLAHFKICE